MNSVARQAYQLYLRGVKPETIAEQLDVPVVDVARYIAEKTVVSGAAEQRVAAADTLRLLKVKLFSEIDQVDPSRRAAYVTTLAALETKILQLDGRCGARLQDRPDEYCQDFPVPKRSRCRIHGGLTPSGRASPHFVTGKWSNTPIPLAEGEEDRFWGYRSDPVALDERIAIAKLQHDRAVAAGNSGNAEAQTVARLIQVYATVKGMVAKRPYGPEVGRVHAILLDRVAKAVEEICGADAVQPVLSRAYDLVDAVDWRAMGVIGDIDFPTPSWRS